MKAVGVILAGGNNDKLGMLTTKRALCALPVGGCYRCLDFPLSNLSNSGIKKVAVLTQYNNRSLHDHLSSSKWWDMGRKQGGLFIFSPYLTDDNSYWFRGTADSLYQNLTFLKRSNEPYVVITNGNIICKIDYNDVLDRHIETGADVTIVYKQGLGVNMSDYGVLTLDENEQIIDFEEKPLDPQTDILSAGIYVIGRTLLIKLLEVIIPEGRYDLVKDIFIRYRRKIKIMGYHFDGYWSAINRVQAYFNTNMDFLKEDIRDLFTRQPPYIETKPKDEPPAKYNSGADVKDCLVGCGSILNGHASHSILFRRVFTGEGSVVRNCVIMEGSFISNNCVLEYAILDKEVVISDGKQIIGTKDNPVIVAKGSVV